MKYLFALLLLLLTGPAFALQADEVLADPVLEARARALGKELRCVVCQSESIDDSPADMARDMRRLVRERLAAGDDEAAVKQYLQQRYGDKVLMRPPVQENTALLWAAPLLGLGLGILLMRGLYRREPHRRQSP